MTWLRVLALRFSGMFAKRRRDAQIEEELQSHLEMLVEQNLQRGMPANEARRTAKLSMGGAEQIKEAVRDQRGLPFLESLIADTRFALRMLSKSPGFTTVAILTLALGIGANTAIFSFTYGVLLKSLPYPDSSRIVQIWGESDRTHHSRLVYISAQDFHEVQQRTHSFEQTATYLEANVTLVGESGPESLQSTLVSGNFFSVLGARPLLGRPILPDDDQPGHDQVAVLSYELWQRRFGADSEIVGRKISIVAMPMGAFRSSPSPPKPYTIIGVLPPIFPLPNRGQILVPESAWANIFAAVAIARLKDGASLGQANAELQAISPAIASEYPKTEKGLRLSVTTLRERITRNYMTGLLVLLCAVGFLLLLACVSVGSLLIARSWVRQGEVAIREALGATRSRLLRQFLTESVLLAFLGGVLGILIAFWGVHLLRVIAPPDIPRLNEIRLNWPVLGYSLGTSLLAGVLFGLAPAVLSSRAGSIAHLKEIRAGSFGRFSWRSPHSLRNTLIVAEIAMSFLLVTASGLAARSLWKLTNVDMGFRAAHVLTMWVNFSSSMCPKVDTCNTAMNEVLEGVASLPGVQSAAFANWHPLSDPFAWPIQIRGISDSVPVVFQQVTPRYFETIGIPVLKGRSFAVGDTPDSPPVAVVNTTMARNYFDGSPLGKTFSMGRDKSGRPIWLEIVGEVGDTRDINPSKSPVAAFYIPFSQVDSMFRHALVVRASSNPLLLLPAIREQVWTVDKNAPVPEAQTMEQTISDSTAQPRFQTLLIGAFGSIALLLAVVGIYGLVSYSVAQRTHEMGVRLTLGAQPGDIMRLVLGEGILMAAIGIMIGIVSALAVTKYLGSLLFEVQPSDPITFFCVAALLMGVALLACYIPARRAMKVDPMVALRYE